VGVFRRRSAGASETAAQDPAGDGGPDALDATKTARSPAEAAKGRPTPKRSEAERLRRQPFTGTAGRPGGGKAASGQSKSRDRADRARKYEAMKRGEDWALPQKDKGPVRAIARDYVDSRRRASEYCTYLLLLLFVLVFTRSTVEQDLGLPLVGVVLLVLVTESLLISRGVRRLSGERYPGESTKGIFLYSARRAMQIRKLRVPAPRVGPGVKPAS
jgi:hypothetical protein